MKTAVCLNAYTRQYKCRFFRNLRRFKCLAHTHTQKRFALGASVVFAWLPFFLPSLFLYFSFSLSCAIVCSAMKAPRVSLFQENVMMIMAHQHHLDSFEHFQFLWDVGGGCNGGVAGDDKNDDGRLFSSFFSVSKTTLSG